MKSNVLLASLLMLGVVHDARPSCHAQDTDQLDLTVQQPLTDREKHCAVQLSRLPGARLSWNEKNRIVAVSLKGADANRRAVELSSALPGLRALALVALPQQDLDDHSLAPLAGHPELRLLSISGTRLSDAALQHVAACPALEIVMLQGRFTDDGVATLAQLPKLASLDLTQCPVTDAGAAHLASATGLQTLILNDTRVTNDCLPSIALLKKLTQLYLGDTALDDDAVPQLQALEQLELLFLKGTGLTQQGIQQLLQELPLDCRVIHDYGTGRGQRTPRTAQSDTPATEWRVR